MRLTHKALRAACLEAADAYSGRLEQAAEDGPTPALSPALAAGLPALRRRAHRQQALHRTMQSAAAFFLMVLLGCATVAAVPEARAAVLSWVVKLGGNEAVYRFNGTEGGELPDYAPTWLPEGFALMEEHEDAAIKRLLYSDGQSGLILFEYGYMTGNTEIALLGENRPEYETLTVQGMTAHFYASGNGSAAADLICFDEERNVFFSLNGNLEKSIILHIAESISLSIETKN